MAEAPGVLFLQTAMTVLGTLNTSPRYWGGAYARQVTVEMRYRDIKQINEYPYVSLLVDTARFAGGTQDYFEDTLDCRIFAVIEATAELPAVAWALRLRRDLRQTLWQAVSLNGALAPYVLRLDLVDRPDDDPFEYLDHLAAFELPFTATLADVF